MDDGGASACSMILFLVLLFIEAVLVGFNKAINLMNEKEIERRAEEEKDKKSILLRRIIERATIYVNSIQMITTLIELVMGYFFLPRWAFLSKKDLQSSLFGKMEMMLCWAGPH